MSYVQPAAAPEFFGNWPGLGAVRSARQRRRGAKRRRKRARKLARTTAGRAVLAQAAARVSAGTATGRQRRLVSSAGVVARRARKPGLTRRLRMVRELAATKKQRRAAREAGPAPPRPVLVTDEGGIVPPPPMVAEGPRPRRLDFVRRLAEDRARREAESGTPRVALRPRFFDEPPVRDDFGPDRQPFDFGPSRAPFDFPSTRGEVAPEADPSEAGATPAWLIPAAAAAAAAFLI